MMKPLPRRLTIAAAALTLATGLAGTGIATAATPTPPAPTSPAPAPQATTPTVEQMDQMMTTMVPTLTPQQRDQMLKMHQQMRPGMQQMMSGQAMAGNRKNMGATPGTGNG